MEWAEGGQQYSTAISPVKGTLQEDMIPSGWNIQEKHQESPNNTQEMPCQGYYIELCSVWQLFRIQSQHEETYLLSLIHSVPLVWLMFHTLKR